MPWVALSQTRVTSMQIKIAFFMGTKGKGETCLLLRFYLGKKEENG